TEILVVVAENMLLRLQRELAHLLLSRSAINANGDTIGRPFEVFKITYHQRGQIRRHFRRRGETYGVLVFTRTRRVGNYFRIGNRHISLLGYGGNVKSGFVVRLIK